MSFCPVYGPRLSSCSMLKDWLEKEKPEVSSLISCDAVLMQFSCILAKFGQILTQNCRKIEVPRGTGILLRFKTALQLINELISEDLIGSKSSFETYSFVEYALKVDLF